jgi:hypothetical protein
MSHIVNTLQGWQQQLPCTQPPGKKNTVAYLLLPLAAGVAAQFGIGKVLCGLINRPVCCHTLQKLSQACCSSTQHTSEKAPLMDPLVHMSAGLRAVPACTVSELLTWLYAIQHLQLLAQQSYSQAHLRKCPKSAGRTLRMALADPAEYQLCRLQWQHKPDTWYVLRRACAGPSAANCCSSHART